MVVEAPRTLFEAIGKIVVRVDLKGARELYRQELEPVVLDREGHEMLGVEVLPGKVEVTVTLNREEPENNE